MSENQNNHSGEPSKVEIGTLSTSTHSNSSPSIGTGNASNHGSYYESTQQQPSYTAPTNQSNTTTTGNNDNGNNASTPIRQDLVQSAIRFLNDPKVQQSPLAKRIAFLDSKGLTQAEIQEALSKMNGGGSSASATTTSPNSATPHTTAANSASAQPPAVPPLPPMAGVALPPSSTQQAYYPYVPGMPYPQQYQQMPAGYVYPYGMILPPPKQQTLQQKGRVVGGWEWKDWTLAAISISGLSFGAYSLAKKYNLFGQQRQESLTTTSSSEAEVENQLTLISSSLTSASLDHLSQEALETKNLLQKQQEKLEDNTKEMEKLILALERKEKERNENIDSLRREMDSILELVPKVMERNKEAQLNQLQEMQNELRSLKSLVLNRRTSGLGGGQVGSTSTTTGTTTSASLTSSGQSTSQNTPALLTPKSSLVDPDLLNDAASVTSSVDSSGVGGFVPSSKPYIPAWQLQQGGAADSTSTTI